MNLIICIYLFIVGTCIASFLHLYATRTIDGKSIISPQSHCTNCNHYLKWYELIPIFSYIVQKGKCRKCGTKIGKDSLIVEIITGALFVISYLTYGLSWNTLLAFIITMTLICVFISDFKEMIILDSTILVSTILTYIVIFFAFGLTGIYKSFLYGVFGFVFLFLVKILGDAFFKRESLGGGDVKLAFLIGSLLPSNLFIVVLFVGSLFALPYALITTNSTKIKEFAYGPFLMLGLFVVFLYQNDIINIINVLIE